MTAELTVVFAIAVSAARAGPEQPVLTPDQQAIVDKIAKGTNPNNVLYTEASTDHIGTEVRLPFRRGKYITLTRTGSVVRKDGSWHGKVEETGERAVLMLWVVFGSELRSRLRDCVF